MVEATKGPGGAAIRIASYGPHGAHIDLDVADDSARAQRTETAVRELESAFPAAEVVRGAGTIGLFLSTGNLPEHETIVRCLTGAASSTSDARVHAIPVVYDGADLDDLSRELRLSRPELIALHTGQDLLCELVGFMPGFAYLGSNPTPLILPRRARPRARVPAGSVAVAGAFSGVYPFESPGGWHLLGRSLGPSLFDPHRAEPSLIAPGDRLRFVPVGPADAPKAGRTLNIQIALGARPAERGLVVLEAPPLATLQDEGRRGTLGIGVPMSGPLIPEAHRRARRAVGNAPGAAGLEIVGGALRIRAVGCVRLALDDGSVRVLEDGESCVVPAGESWARYLSIEGGFEAERVLGSRATLVGAGFGGYEGRALRPGDFLAVSTEESRSTDAPGEGANEVSSEEAGPVFVEPGPHALHFASGAFERFIESVYEVSPLSNRVGQRLFGPRVARLSPDTLLPTPMIRGAIEVPASGEPIVLGPDHPTTGGYPVLAVVRPESFDTMGRLGPGRRFRFARR